ncbi:MAG: hypothetical protein Q9211_001667 [Gyalolechia sp. 1 TL-2023]
MAGSILLHMFSELSRKANTVCNWKWNGSGSDLYCDSPTSPNQSGPARCLYLGASNEIRRLDLEIKSAESPVTTANLPSFSSGGQEVIAVPDLEDLVLRNYSFLPQSRCLPVPIRLARIKNIELDNCSNTGYLFNNMLSVYQDMRLESLKIVDRAFKQVRGYVGKDKLDHFLVQYKGLKLLEIGG